MKNLDINITMIPIKTAMLLKSLLISPWEVFNRNLAKESKIEILCLFFLGAIFTLLRSFSFKNYRVNFYESSIINSILTVVTSSQFQWFLAYACYFLFLFLAQKVCMLMLKKCNQKGLFFNLLSISGLGIIVQILFMLLYFVVPMRALYYICYFVVFWFICLSIIAIKQSQGSTYSRAIMIFVFSASPVFLLYHLPGIFPYLMWIVYGGIKVS